MNARCLILAFALVPWPAVAQDGAKWKPYQFVGNERYEFKITMMDEDAKKESGYVLDIRNKGEEDWDVTWSTKSAMKKSQRAEVLMRGKGAGLNPAMFLMNPVFGAFLEQVELKVGEKMSLLGAGVVKVVKKETVGGRTGFLCELITKPDDKDQLTWSVTVDPALALPIRSVFFEGGKEMVRVDLVSYQKD